MNTEPDNHEEDPEPKIIKIKWCLSIGFVGATREGTIEVEEDTSDEEISEIVEETVNNYIEWGWNRA